MARTPLASKLEGIAADAAPGRHTRRQALKRAGALGGGLAAAQALGWVPGARADQHERVVIVGAGLAGLSCAYTLGRAGIAAEVYDAADRVGGRCWTLRGAFRDGQVAEHGGELIDQGHTHIRQLSQELGLKLDNLLQGEQNGTEPLFHFDGKPYTYVQATDDLKKAWQKIHSDVSAASYPTLWNLSTERGRELDAMSIVDWIEESIPGGLDSPLGQLLDVAYNIEYGAECSEQSSLNLLYLLGYSGQGQLRVFGPSNEKYHVNGGNDQITEAMSNAIPGPVHLRHELTALRKDGDGKWALTFRTGATTKQVGADRLVLALPFSMLRRLDLRNTGFEARKLRAIREQGMGTNSKMNVGFARRHWRSLGVNGDTYADTGYQATWEVSRAQPGESGILVDYTGGRIGAGFGSGTPESRAKQFLSQIEPVLPGITGAWTGRAVVDHWPGYPWTRGSYSYWKVGQYTAFAGMEGQRQGNCHFAGEHTSIDFQGYLNGAVETGQRAAAEVLAEYK